MKKGRRLAAAVFDLEEAAGLLRDYDRRADEHFRMLDAMEGKNGQGRPQVKFGGST